MKVGVIFGGRSVEHAISVRSAKTVVDGLAQAGHDVVALAVTEDGTWLSPKDSAEILRSNAHTVVVADGVLHPESQKRSLRHLLEADVDVAFPMVHGTYGEDGTLQGLLEMIGIPYVGCGVLASALCMDKMQSKKLLEAAGVAVVPWIAVPRNLHKDALQQTLAKTHAWGLPLFVKPSVGGSSVGCRLVKTREELLDAVQFARGFDDVVLVEKGVDAREVEVAVLGSPGDFAASVVGEIVPGAEFYDYQDKYLKNDAKLLAPAPLPQAVTDQLRAAAILAMEVVGGSGLARVDFFVDKKTHAIALNELNTLPGFTSASMYPRLWALSGVPLPQLCDRLVRIAVERSENQKHIQNGIRTFVASVAR